MGLCLRDVAGGLGGGAIGSAFGDMVGGAAGAGADSADRLQAIREVSCGEGVFGRCDGL